MNNSEHYLNQTPSNKIIILGLSPNMTETDVSNINGCKSIVFKLYLCFVNRSATISFIMDCSRFRFDSFANEKQVSQS